MSSHLSRVLKIFILFIIYFITANFGLKLEPISGFATLVWAPSGIALAAIFLYGYELWPGVWLGAYAANLFTGAPIQSVLGIATGNTMEAILAVYLLKKVTGFRETLDRLWDVFHLILFAGVIACALGATVGTLSLWFAHAIQSDNFLSTWIAWWIGDVLGILVIAPFLMILTSYKQFKMPLYKGIEFIFLLLTLFLISTFIFRGLFGIQITPNPITYLVYPVLIWASIRFRQFGTVTSILLLSVITISNTILGFGPFVRDKLSESLFLLQSFMGITSITFLTLGAVIEERKFSENRKDDFIRIASHELKTPIASIKGLTEILLSQRLSNKTKYLLNRINTQTDRLVNLVNGLLDIASIRTGQIEFRKETFKIDEFIKSIAEDFQTTSPGHTIIFKSKANSFVYADKSRLTQILNNLITNAVKFSPKKGKIIITAHSNKNFVEVSVKDFGIGISKRDQTMMFEPFFQVENENRRSYSGLGVGLHISSEMLKGQNGRLWVQSQPGKGSKFIFRLPKGK